MEEIDISNMTPEMIIQKFKEKDLAFKRLEEETNKKVKKFKISFEELEKELEKEKSEDNKKIKKLEEVIEEKDKKTLKMQKNFIPLSELYKKSLQPLIFQKIVTKSTDHTSNHEEIYEEYKSKFKRLKNIEKYINIDELNITPSLFLIACKKKKYIISFSGETEMHYWVNLYFTDILDCTILNLSSTLEGSVGGIVEEIKKDKPVKKDKTKKDEKYKRSTPDSWIVLNNDGRPILVIEIKSPGTTFATGSEGKSKIEHRNVTGQLFDYMIKLKSFYNQKYVFGILTTLDEWKICWLADSDKCAESDVLLELGIEEDDTYELENIDYKRTVHSSKTYKYDDKNLSTLILSVIIKSYESPKYPVNLLSLERTYVSLLPFTWRWERFDSVKNLEKIKNSLTLKLPSEGTNEFKVLRYFNGGKYSRIRLAVSNNGNLVILKEFLDDDEISDNIHEQELKCWKKINGADDAYITELNKNKTLIIPLVFHIHVNDEEKKIYIPVDLKVWSVEDKAIPGELPTILKDINKQLKKYVKKNPLNIKEITANAIKKCAKRKYVHNDLEFRHIAVRPIFDDEDTLIYLDPMFIDFGRMKKVDSSKEAKIEMTERMNELFDIYKGYEGIKEKEK